ncbi:MAG TPA: TlpA disulfide reductase family protein [Candidatus Elarobacter sp.]|jgi:thiol-disulfide isomerase/thioredoxin|nr:TlpA disulfide reductase family protein [Candidatus Elarobacter sp.]
MIQRVQFVLGAAFSLASLPLAARARSAPKPEQTEKPHVHGRNGVVTLPENRPIEWSMDVLDGPPFKLSAYRGKVVFLNVFATWCPPCRTEAPAVVEFAAAHPDDTAVVGVDVDEEDNDVRAYRKKFGITYPIAMDRYDKIVRGVYREGKMIFPTTIVFRPDGTLSCAWAGDVDVAFFENERKYALGLAD